MHKDVHSSWQKKHHNKANKIEKYISYNKIILTYNTAKRKQQKLQI